MELTAGEQRAAARERARTIELLKAKKRAIGIDTQTLDAQIALAERRRLREAEENRAERDAMQATMAYAEQLEDEVEEERLRELEELRATWAVQSDRRQRAEYDLSDPARRRKDRPARDGDGDCGLGPSSMQVFAGEANEDPDIPKRLRAELLDGNDRLLAKRAREAERKRREEAAELAATRAMMAEAEDAEAAMEAERAEEARRLALDNRALAQAARHARRQAEREAKEAERMEVTRMMSDPTLTEARGLGAHAAAGHRVRRDHYKGFSKERLAALQADQQAQIELNRRRRQAEQEQDRKDAAALARAMAEAEAAEEEADRERAEEARRLQLERRAQLREDRLRKKREKKERLEGDSAGFFRQIRRTLK